MHVYFKPTESRPTYRGTGMLDGSQTVFECRHEGEYDWPDEKVEQVCADFPENFSKVGGSKSAKGPSHNRAAPPPGKDK